MPRKKYKFYETITLGYTDQGKPIRKYIGSDSRTEFERLKRAAIIEAEKIRNPSGITLGAYADKWFSTYNSNKSIQTRNQYQYAIDKLRPIRNLPLKDVTASDLQGIINNHFEHPRTCEVLRLVIRQIYDHAITDGIIYPVNLGKNLTIPKYKTKERRFITDIEMEKIKKIEFKGIDQLYIDILINTGMRPSEPLALQWSDINFSELTITVRRSLEFDRNAPRIKATKTSEIRTIPITPQFATRLSQILKSSLFVIARKDNSLLTKSAYRRMSERILAQINVAFGGSEQINVLDGLVIYSFRHTYATKLYYNAVKPGIISTKQAAKIMGHSEEMFLQRYTHLDGAKEQLDTLRKVL